MSAPKKGKNSNAGNKGRAVKKIITIPRQIIYCMYTFLQT